MTTDDKDRAALMTALEAKREYEAAAEHGIATALLPLMVVKAQHERTLTWCWEQVRAVDDWKVRAEQAESQCQHMHDRINEMTARTLQLEMRLRHARAVVEAARLFIPLWREGVTGAEGEAFSELKERLAAYDVHVRGAR